MKRILIALMIGIGLMSSVLAQDNGATVVSYGESFVGEFTEDADSVTVNFEGNVSDRVYVSVLDNNVPAEITLLSPTGGQLAFIDDAYLGNIELGAEGQYSVVITRPEWSENVGEFIGHIGLYTVEELSVEDDSTLFYEGNLADAGALQQFEVDLNAGEIATIRTYGANIGLVINTPSGENLIFDGLYNDPEVPLIQFPETGTYQMHIITAEPDGTDIGLTIFRHNRIAATTGEPMTGEMVEDLPIVFAFEAVAGKMWDLNAILPDTGTRFMAIYQFDGRPQWQTQIYQDQGSGPNGQPRISPFIPQTDDTYFVALWYDDWNTELETYDYTLTISPSTVLSLPNNSPVIGEITEESGIAKYAYTGKAGDRVRVVFRKIGGDGQLRLRMLSPEDEVASFFGRNTTVSSFDVELPLDATYEFEIGNASYDIESTLEFEILIEPMGN